MSLVRTAHWGDWTLDQLLAAKGGQRVSLVVPARNEAATVGDVVARVRAALMDTVDLLDEIVVIDSDSTDATYEVAASAGAVVHRAAEIRPDLGTRPGKGEAMWKSLFVTSGDVLVFMDADLLDWDTHFVPGLLGPLLVPGVGEGGVSPVGLVKGFYRRPGADGPLEGGRVTELVARPLIALLFPELADLVQPLAGEWAIRRSLFASLSVPTGYAVELAALVDVVRLSGVEGIAQVDLGVRAHRHQALHDLGGMATQILAAGLARAGVARAGVGGRDGGEPQSDLSPDPGSHDNSGWGSPTTGTEAHVLLRQFGLDDPAGLNVRERAVPTDERPPAKEYL